jgi:hypothetical protein
MVGNNCSHRFITYYTVKQLPMTTVITYYTVKQSPMTTVIIYYAVTYDYSYYLTVGNNCSRR